MLLSIGFAGFFAVLARVPLMGLHACVYVPSGVSMVLFGSPVPWKAHVELDAVYGGGQAQRTELWDSAVGFSIGLCAALTVGGMLVPALRLGVDLTTVLLTLGSHCLCVTSVAIATAPLSYDEDGQLE
jgi:hypothetical protein